MEWPALLERDFRPYEVDKIADVKDTARRQWKLRYGLDLDAISKLSGGDDDSRWYSWAAVQIVAVFARTLEDTGSPEVAKAMTLIYDIPNFHRDGIGRFNEDCRNQHPPKFLHIDLAQPALVAFQWSGDTALLGPRSYLLNLSALQDELVGRVDTQATKKAVG